MNILVIGGGITGRLVQHALPEAKLFDWGSPPADGRLTRQWGANYLWKPIPGLSCREFPVITHVDGEPATAASIRRYKEKVGKGDEPQDSWWAQFQEHTTGYEFTSLPPAEIQYGMRVVEILADRRCVVWSNGVVMSYDFLVSTIPLFSLLDLLGEVGDALRRWTDGRLTYQPIYVRAMARPPDARYPPETLYVNYLSDPTLEPYRWCDRGAERHYEGLTAMGAVPNKKLVPGKIRDLPSGIRLSVMDRLNRMGIYCFGRYASWNSDELVHQTWRQIDWFAGQVREAQ